MTALLVVKRTNKPTPASGFTLIELLVVIAIIAILAAILFPVFASARAKARQVNCINNLKSLGLAVLQYEQDYDEVYPMDDYGTGSYVAPSGAPASTYPTGNPAGLDPAYTIADVLNPYIKTNVSSIWRCLDYSGIAKTSNSYIYRPWDYGYNGALLGMMYPTGGNTTTCTTSAEVAQANQIVSPSATLMMCDAMGGYNASTGAYVMFGGAVLTNPAGWNDFDWTVNKLDAPFVTFPGSSVNGPLGTWPNSIGLFGYASPAPRHPNLTVDVLYCDGHVKSQPIAPLVSHVCCTKDPLCQFCNGL